MKLFGVLFGTLAIPNRSAPPCSLSENLKRGARVSINKNGPETVVSGP
jgi:hypothetical protein